MAGIRKVSVALTEDQVTSLRAAVAAGEYATTSEIVREAIRDWQFKHELRQQEISRLRELWDHGKDSGEAAPLDFDKLKIEARRRVASTADPKDVGR